MKTLLQIMPPLQGEVTLGASLKIGYFAQAHEDLDPERTLVEEIGAVKPDMLLGEVRQYLAQYLFSGEDVFKKVAVLSGGERGRLALAKLSLANANLLLLDEPSNHLDIPSQEILQEVLAAYQGTILLVSHDRYLIDALASQIWEIRPDQAWLQVFAGTYSQYHAFLDQQEAERQAQRLQAQANTSSRSGANQKARPAAITPEERKRRQRLKEVEGLIGALEENLSTLSIKLENPAHRPGQSAKAWAGIRARPE